MSAKGTKSSLLIHTDPQNFPKRESGVWQFVSRLKQVCCYIRTHIDVDYNNIVFTLNTCCYSVNLDCICTFVVSILAV